VTADRAFVIFMRVHLVFPQSGSLKAKRAELNSIKAHLRTRNGASVAEVGHQDSWQRSTLAVSVCAGSAGRCEEAADAIGRYLDARLEEGAHVERHLASWADLEGLE
jgi:uncharacterized protein YlxP (DUF503 family)